MDASITYRKERQPPSVNLSNVSSNKLHKENYQNKEIKTCAVSGKDSQELCPFSSSLPSEYIHGKDNFCILHLPFEAVYYSNGIERGDKKDLLQKKQQAFESMVADGNINFRFITVGKVEIKLGNTITLNNDLNFESANIHSFIIVDERDMSLMRDEEYSLHSLNLKKTKIWGRLVLKGVRVEFLIIKKSRIQNNFLIEKSQINDCVIVDSEFGTTSKVKGLAFQKRNYGINIQDSTLKYFNFVRNNCELQLSIQNTSLCDADLRSYFHICPQLFHAEFSNSKSNLRLPLKENFKLKIFFEDNEIFIIDLFKVGCIKFFHKCLNFFYIKLLILCRFIPKGYRLFFKIEPKIENAKKWSENNIAQIQEKNKPKNEIINIQYQNFRELFNIAKSKNMYHEMGDYFYLMQRTFEESMRENVFARFASRFYRWVSDYGQSIIKPIVLLLIWNSFDLI